MSNRRNRFVAPFLLALGIATLSGCGGGNPLDPVINPTTYELTASNAILDPNESFTIEAISTNAGVTGHDFQVEEAGGGTVVQGTGSQTNTARYTAPPTLGTFHVRVRFFRNSEVRATRTFTATVAVASE
ncbi:hypothetical protein EON81_16520 [bacterium]|nr:MAG: hypothetical protein EON81_16520 [bacterium]